MTADPTVLDRIFNRLVRALSVGSPDQLSAPFTVSDIVHALVPYRTYRAELGVDTVQDYEHAVLELLAGERGLLVVDPDTVAAIRKELASPDPDTGMLRRLQQVEARLGAVRMPILIDERATAPREVILSDAAVIGAAMELEDAELARATSVDQRPKAVAATPAPAVPTPALPLPVASPADTLPSVADLTALVPAESPVSTPLPSVQGVTLASAATLARITPLNTPSVYGDPIDFRGVRHAPVDIGGVIFLFGMIARELGFHVEALSSGFPRCEAKRQLAPGKWARLRIDFELESRHFRDAGRNPATVDLIICWRDTWPNRAASIDVLALDRILPTLARD
jgi:hypothetical protein